ncbi:sulfotransferase domain-containing protein [Roseicyclus sp. F158]|uniref:Sulfotransferase domain-containing protein n=1 Tax=Tropicimonas omnivorans TaxID=3075590 RepID=A0ABU3DLJ4_9RHOB|nr:sulfotransferase domain-containing protein [Roseicyclus sp. F158]MDT0684531.1 sulfotransferase domain-containing protein [Roseicyclus sp. F158]
MLPNFFHAGVPKSASATVNTLLRNHPEVFLPRQKEPNFFIRDDNFVKGLGWYVETYFAAAGDARIRGDMSIGHATGFGFDAIDRIAGLMEAPPKILLTFRDPIARAFSQYGMARDKGQLDRLDFAAAIDRALAAGPAINKADRRRARTGTYYASDADMDVYRWCMYVEPGHYADIYEAWAGTFGTDNVLVLLTEDLASDLQGQADSLCDFLGIARRPVEAGTRANTATGLRYPALRRMLNRLYALGPLRRVLNRPELMQLRKMLRRRLLSANYVPVEGRSGPDPATVERLRAHYAPQVERLETLLGRDLSRWRGDAAFKTVSGGDAATRPGAAPW